MHRAYDPGQTIREKGLNAAARLNTERFFHESNKREMENGVSRSSLVHGTQTNPNSDTWYDTDAFLLDQVKEVLNKLSEGSIDDEIWGKIVIMERCKRVAKAYLRKTTVIIDGSEDEFDGKTLGFNHFDNPTRDDHTKEIRAKIADGVILKMDYQGNIKGMARGAAPIVCQGWKEPRNNCISDRVVRLHGKLNHGVTEDEKAYKVFDMRKFKHALERELHDGTPDARSLLLKTCMRIALVKDGADMNRTPCWFAIVNLVALDMIKEKIPAIKSLLNGSSLPIMTSPPPNVGNDPSALDATYLTQIIAAAVTQANKGAPTPVNNNNNQNLTISPEQLAQIASTISIAQTNTLRTADLAKKERPKKPYHCSTSSLDSSGEDSSGRRSEASIAIKSRAKRWEQMQKINEREKYTESPDLKIIDKPRPGGRAHRPSLQDVIFTRSHSITSDYDSNKEHFDSGSWSSTQSRYKGGRSTSSSVVSEHELAALARDELKETSEIREANAVSEDDEPPTNPPSPAPVMNVPTLPRKDYNLSPTTEHATRSVTAIPSEQFVPTLEGAPVWKPRTVAIEPEHSPPTPITATPPPLPKTPQPNNGLPNASLPYNHNNNAGSFTRAAARRWKFTSAEPWSSPILNATDQTRSSANSVRFSSNERAVYGSRATTLNQPQFIPTCDSSAATLANSTTLLPNSTTTSAATAAAGATLRKEPIHSTSGLLRTKCLADSGGHSSTNTNSSSNSHNETSSNHNHQHNASHRSTTANLLCVANQHQQSESTARDPCHGDNINT